MAFKLEVTMGELLNAALGTSRLTQNHLDVLRLLINLLLKKLNCEDEQVTIGGYASKCLEQLRRVAQQPEIPTNSKKMMLFGEKWDQLAKAEEHLTTVDATFTKHLEDIRIYRGMHDSLYDCPHWERYASACEDLCTMPEPVNAKACYMVRSTVFMYPIMKMFADPIERRWVNCIQQIEKCSADLQALKDYADEECIKLRLLPNAIQRIEKMRTTIAEQKVEFYETIEEIQAMLEAKVDKVHLPGLRKYIKTITNNILLVLKEFYKSNECPKDASERDRNTSVCLSCGGCRRPKERIFFKFPPPSGVYCGCDGLICSSPYNTIMDRMQVLNIHNVRESLLRRGRKSCTILQPVHLT